jgi:hypothetical protein
LSFFEVFRIEGFLSFEDSIDLVDQLLHDGFYDLYFLFAFGRLAFGHRFANGVVSHGLHGGEEQVSAQLAAGCFSRMVTISCIGAVLENAHFSVRIW